MRAQYSRRIYGDVLVFVREESVTARNGVITTYEVSMVVQTENQSYSCAGVFKRPVMIINLCFGNANQHKVSQRNREWNFHMLPLAWNSNIRAFSLSSGWVAS